MKKRVYLSLFITLISLFSAVNARAWGVQYGVMAGVNTTSMTGNVSALNIGSEALDLNLRGATGFQIGFKFGLDLPLIDIAPEIWYTNNKAKMVDEIPGVGGISDVRSHSIDVPILASISVLGPINVKLGPSFTLMDTAKFANGTTIEGGVKSTFGYVVGVCLNLMDTIEIDLRYNGQFSDTQTPWGWENELPMANVRSSSFSLVLGYRFN